MAEASGATAAINGDFFDIDRSFAPTGVGVDRADGLVTSPIGDHTNAIAVDHTGVAHLAEVLLDGTVTGESGSADLSGVNTSVIPADGIGLYTSTWGEYPRTTAVGDASTVTELTLVDGVVVDIADEPGDGPIDEDELVLLGRDAGALTLQQLSTSPQIDVTYAPRADFGEVALALGGSHQRRGLVHSRHPHPRDRPTGRGEQPIGWRGAGGGQRAQPVHSGRVRPADRAAGDR